MRFKPLAKLTRLLVFLLKVQIGLLALAIPADFYGWFEYSNLAPNMEVEETLLTSDIANAVMGLLQFPLAIFIGITFLRWIYRANKNLRILSSVPMDFSPGWSIGWYFIPIANLFKPYQAMKEIWLVAHRGGENGSSILGWWWFLWLVSNSLGRLAMRLALRENNAQGYVHSAMANLASDAMDVFLNVFAIMLVTAIAKAYAENYVEPDAAANDVPTLSPRHPETEGESSLQG